MPREDAEQAAYIEVQPVGLPYSELAARCRRLFGPERGWTAGEVRDYWLATYSSPHGYCSPVCGDAEMIALIEDYEGRIPHSALFERICAARPADCRPSRSAFYRLMTSRSIKRYNPSGSTKCPCMGRRAAVDRVAGRDNPTVPKPRS